VVKHKSGLSTGFAPRMLNRRAAATYCGVSEATFNTYVVPCVQSCSIGSKLLWDVRALDRWLDRLASTPASTAADELWTEALTKL
jgi:hypothetical protein